MTIFIYVIKTDNTFFISKNFYKTMLTLSIINNHLHRNNLPHHNYNTYHI